MQEEQAEKDRVDVKVRFEALMVELEGLQNILRKYLAEHNEAYQCVHEIAESWKASAPLAEVSNVQRSR